MRRAVMWAYVVATRGPGPCFALFGGLYLALCGASAVAWWLL